MAMLTKSGISGSAPISEINVTPMVDVMLVLLIIFMITAPMLTTGLKVNLPQSKAAQILNPKEPVVITIMKNNVISLGDHPIARDDLISAVKAKLQAIRVKSFIFAATSRLLMAISSRLLIFWQAMA